MTCSASWRADVCASQVRNAPIAAPMRPTAAIAPAIESPAGAEIASTEMSPSGPTSPGTARLTASMSACQASGLPASHSAATENPRSTPAKIENSDR